MYTMQKTEWERLFGGECWRYQQHNHLTLYCTEDPPISKGRLKFPSTRGWWSERELTEAHSDVCLFLLLIYEPNTSKYIGQFCNNHSMLNMYAN